MHTHMHDPTLIVKISPTPARSAGRRRGLTRSAAATADATPAVDSDMADAASTLVRMQATDMSTSTQPIITLVMGGHTEVALNITDLLLKQRPTDPSLHHCRSLCLYKLGKSQEALVTLETHVIGGSLVAPEALLTKAMCLKDLGRHQDAVAVLDSLQPQRCMGDDLYRDVQLCRAMCLAAAGHALDAVASADRVLELQPNHTQAACLRMYQLASAGRVAEAMDATTYAIRSCTGAPACTCAYVLSCAATTYMLLRRYPDALATYSMLLTYCPCLPDAMHGRATCLRALGRVEEALMQCNVALASLPPNVPSRIVASMNMLRASCIACDKSLLKGERLAEVLLCVQRALAAVPGMPRAVLLNAALMVHARPAPLPSVLRQAVQSVKDASVSGAVLLSIKAVVLASLELMLWEDQSALKHLQQVTSAGGPIVQERTRQLRAIAQARLGQPVQALAHMNALVSTKDVTARKHALLARSVGHRWCRMHARCLHDVQAAQALDSDCPEVRYHIALSGLLCAAAKGHQAGQLRCAIAAFTRIPPPGASTRCPHHSLASSAASDLSLATTLNDAELQARAAGSFLQLQAAEQLYMWCPSCSPLWRTDYLM